MKKQTRELGVAGGFINQIMGNNRSEPVVGGGATKLFYSDRQAYEVIRVSEDGLKCTIRDVHSDYCGTGYGDEKYTYRSDENGYTQLLEWSDKEGCWGEITYTVEIIKSLKERYYKEYGYNAIDHLLKHHGLSDYQELYEDPEADNYFNQPKVIKGLTKEYKNFHRISIIFGIMETYRDPSF
tara:strand:- start:343 stop:888 length:546 start_codon:yes stop_codon:yes gene_type:complete